MMTVIRISAAVGGSDRPASIQALLRKWNAIGKVLSMKAEEKIKVTKTFTGTDEENKKWYDTDQEAYVDFSIVVSIRDFKVEVIEKYEIPRETVTIG